MLGEDNIINAFSPNRAIMRASVCIDRALGTIGFNDEIKVIYLYRGTKRVKH